MKGKPRCDWLNAKNNRVAREARPEEHFMCSSLENQQRELKYIILSSEDLHEYILQSMVMEHSPTSRSMTRKELIISLSWLFGIWVAVYFS